MSSGSLNIKVCGMRDPSNIAELALLAPDYMGFIFYPGSKRYAGDITLPGTEITGTSKRTGVFVNAEFEEVTAKIKAYHLDAVQLHGAEDPALCSRLKSEVAEVIKVFGVDEQFDFDDTFDYVSSCDYFLFDTKTPQHGGAGQTFDWSLLSNYIASVPYFLSGGIGPEEINAILEIDDDRLYAIDLNSRFEIMPGTKNVSKLRPVFDRVR